MACVMHVCQQMLRREGKGREGEGRDAYLRVPDHFQGNGDLSDELVRFPPVLIPHADVAVGHVRSYPKHTEGLPKGGVHALALRESSARPGLLCVRSQLD